MRKVVTDLDIRGALTVQGAPVTGSSPPEIHVGPEAPTGDELVWYDTDEDALPSAGIVSGPTAPASHDVLWLDTSEEAPASTIAPFLLMGA